jgi:hypothetical protein
MGTHRAKSIAKELGRAQLGDERRSARLEEITQAIFDRPGVSLPRAMGGASALEAAYRFLGNEEVSLRAILEPHVAATAERVAAAAVAYCISDTTELRFGGQTRQGMGPLEHGRGVITHLALAVSVDGSRTPLGVLNVETIVRPETPKGRHGTKKSRQQADSESLKWSRGVLAAEEALGARAELIHLMDREADIYALLALMSARNSRFVVRVAQNRRTQTEDDDEVGKLFDLLAASPEIMTREVPLSRRDRGSKRHPRRSKRSAKLSFASNTLTLRRPTSDSKALPPTLTLNFVHVFEKHPPAGEVPIDWKLVTSEPCTRRKDVEAVVDAYCTRWVIEEFFKALKTGCGIERCQLESLEPILNLLAIMLPVAVQLLALRSLAAADKSALALGGLSSLQLRVLRAMSKRIRLPRTPTAQQVLLAIAALGGHLKNNGPPGWVVLSRGFQDLLRYTEAFEVFENGRKM